MLIANPIYDTVFKFLLEDLHVAKRIISIIIGEEIIELQVNPQEQFAKHNMYLRIMFRVNFTATIRTDNGSEKKVLIELQKSKNGFDVMRFRHYLGVNYSNPDEVSGKKAILPILPIYFLGFPLSIQRPVLKVGRQYQDLSSGEFISQKDDFIEQLSHDCFVVQIPSLTEKAQTKIERILSIFNQKWLFDKEKKWLLQYDGTTEDEDVQLLLKRLSLAIETPNVKEQIRVEETFDESMDRALREKEELLAQKEVELEQKDMELEQTKNELEALRKQLEALKNK
jgi:hypothetical protein